MAPQFSPDRPTLLLNAHIDTVRPNPGWTRDPFKPTLEGDRLYGLGSNDCGGGLVSLLEVFKYYALTAPEACAYNLVYLASAEEEVSGGRAWRACCPCCLRLTWPWWASLRACSRPWPRRDWW